MTTINQHLAKHYRKYQLIGLLIGFLIASFSISAQETFTASQKGKGPAIIFIPGLMSDSSVWDDFAEQFEQAHQVHQISIAGFAGSAPIENWSIDRVVGEVARYIADNDLQAPIIVGHSLGGFVALKLAVDYPQAVGKVVSVDGLPFLAPIFTRDPQTKAEDMRQRAEQIKKYYAALSPEQVRESTRNGVYIQARNEDAQEKILAMAERSDPRTVGIAISELMTTDLREDLTTTQTPILVLGASGAFSSEQEHEFAERLYQQQVSQAPTAKLLMNRDARHFMMWEAPEWVASQIASFM